MVTDKFSFQLQEVYLELPRPLPLLAVYLATQVEQAVDYSVTPPPTQDLLCLEILAILAVAPYLVIRVVLPYLVILLLLRGLRPCLDLSRLPGELHFLETINSR